MLILSNSINIILYDILYTYYYNKIFTQFRHLNLAALIHHHHHDSVSIISYFPFLCVSCFVDETKFEKSKENREKAARFLCCCCPFRFAVCVCLQLRQKFLVCFCEFPHRYLAVCILYIYICLFSASRFSSDSDYTMFVSPPS